MTAPTPDQPIPEERVRGILARAAELDRDRHETSTVDALRAAALEAGISQSALDVALEEYAESMKPAQKSPAPKSGKRGGAMAEAPEIAAPEPGEKSERVGTLLAVFLGGFGGHRFYLKDKRGLLYLPFFWTFVPTVVGLGEAFFMKKRVRAYNRRVADPDTQGDAVDSTDTPALADGDPQKSLGSGEAEARQPCPHCAELIMPGAKICRFCHGTVRPPDAPHAEDQSGGSVSTH